MPVGDLVILFLFSFRVVQGKLRFRGLQQQLEEAGEEGSGHCWLLSLAAQAVPIARLSWFS